MSHAVAAEDPSVHLNRKMWSMWDSLKKGINTLKTIGIDQVHLCNEMRGMVPDRKGFYSQKGMNEVLNTKMKVRDTIPYFGMRGRRFCWLELPVCRALILTYIQLHRILPWILC